ncbi:MAG: hypothetical protein ACI4T1_01910 [Christensenellales bacterium]
MFKLVVSKILTDGLQFFFESYLQFLLLEFVLHLKLNLVIINSY